MADQDTPRLRGEFVPCSECDRPELCAALKPRSQPCWAVRASRPLLEEVRDFLRYMAEAQPEWVTPPAATHARVLARRLDEEMGRWPGVRTNGQA